MAMKIVMRVMAAGNNLQTSRHVSKPATHRQSSSIAMLVESHSAYEALLDCSKQSIFLPRGCLSLTIGHQERDNYVVESEEPKWCVGPWGP